MNHYAKGWNDALRLAMDYTSHQPQAEPDDVVKDAERYRWLRENGLPSIPFGDLNAAIDAAMLKEGK